MLINLQWCYLKNCLLLAQMGHQLSKLNNMMSGASCNFIKLVAIQGHYLLTLGGPDNILGDPEIKIWNIFATENLGGHLFFKLG